MGFKKEGTPDGQIAIIERKKGKKTFTGCEVTYGFTYVGEDDHMIYGRGGLHIKLDGGPRDGAVATDYLSEPQGVILPEDQPKFGFMKPNFRKSINTMNLRVDYFSEQ